MQPRCYTKSTIFLVEFPSPWLVAIPKLKSPVSPTILPLARIVGFILFPKDMSVMWNAKKPHPGFELGLMCPFPILLNCSLENEAMPIQFTTES